MLQRFRGELQLLDSRGGGADRQSFPDEERGERPSFGKSSTSDRRPALSTGGGGAGPIDDDIPF